MDGDVLYELVRVGAAFGFGFAFGASMWAVLVVLLIGILTRWGFYDWLDKRSGRSDG